jgi:hypothetical protein
MYDAIETMLDTYREAMACNLNNQEAYQKRLVIVNTAWHLLNEAYWSGDADEADEQSYIIQEQVEYSGGGICGGSTSVEVVPCPPWTGGGTGGTYTFSNGLTEAAGNVVWGGSLQQDVTILMADYAILFSGDELGETVSQSISATSGILQKASDGTTEGRVYVTNTLVTLELANLGTPANTRGYEVTSTGIVEKADYSAGYGNLNLVNKLYVDTLFAGAATYIFEQGITETAGVVKLGGTFDEDIEFDFSGSSVGTVFRIFIQDTYPNNSLSVSHGGISLSVMRDIDNIQIINLDADGTPGYWRTEYGGVDHRTYHGNGGFYNDGDYSSYWTDHSLVTKKWVEDNYAVLGSGGVDTYIELTDTPISYTGFGGYFVRVNTGATALEFVAAAFVQATGGTFTGQVTIATSTDRPLIIQQIGAGSTPGTPEGGTNLIAFQDNDGDEQGYVGIDASGNVVLKSWVTGAGILIDSDLEVNGDLIITGVVDGVDIAAWKTSYDIKEAQWDTAYGWGDHAGLYQDVDADLTAIAALGFTTEAFLKKTAVETWALDTEVYASLDYVNSLALTYVYVPDSTTVTTSLK